MAWPHLRVHRGQQAHPSTRPVHRPTRPGVRPDRRAVTVPTADSDTAARVLSTFEYRGEAKLVGLQRVDGDYPTLVPGGSVEGRILRTPDVAALDRYEGVDRGLYVRVSVPRDCDSVATYVGDPDQLNVEAARGSEIVWPGDGPFAERVRRYLAEHEVVVRPTS